METTELNVESSAFVIALERVLPRYGYRTMRSFDLRLDNEATSQATKAQVEQPCQCGCGYTVLLVFPDTLSAGLEGTISVRGIGERSLVSLLAPDNDGELAAQFPTILLEAVGMRSDDAEKSCRCTHA